MEKYCFSKQRIFLVFVILAADGDDNDELL